MNFPETFVLSRNFKLFKFYVLLAAEYIFDYVEIYVRIWQSCETVSGPAYPYYVVTLQNEVKLVSITFVWEKDAARFGERYVNISAVAEM